MTSSSDLSSLQGLSIFLIGMTGTGKTTTGEVLAKELKYHFLDTDMLIEKVTNKPITDIFATEGEESFRNIESQILQEVCAYTKTVVATGGGIILKKMNWSYLKQGLIIWLDAPIDLLVDRLDGDRSRPLLTDTDLKTKLTELWNQRRSLYAEADLHIEIERSQSPSELAANILTQIPKALRHQQS